MLARGIAPPAVVVGGAEVGGGDRDGGAPEAPLGVCLGVAHHLEAGAAGLAAPEHGAAQGGRVDPEPSVEGVVVAASSPCASTMHAKCNTYVINDQTRKEEGGNLSELSWELLQRLYFHII